MGNGASGLPFDLGAEVPSKNSIWDLNEGSRRRLNPSGDEIFDSVLVFRSKKEGSLMEVAKRGSQKLRIMKHPNILGFVDSSELDGTIVVATESAIPLSQWLAHVLGSDNRQNDDITQEIVWGLFCVVNALQFLHRQCKLLHGNINLEAIYVTKTGDWKLGSLELASDVNVDESYFAQYTHLTGDQRAPEVKNGEWRTLFNSTLFGPIDIYSLGTVFVDIFAKLRLDPPGQLGQYLKKMVTGEPKKRPTTAQLLRCPIFTTDAYKGMQAIQELTAKTTEEAISVLVGLNESNLDLTASICTFKIMPVVMRLLGTCMEEFKNRNLRDVSRKNIGICMACLGSFAEKGRLISTEFETIAMPTIIELWNISDRAVRTSLLRSLKGMSPLYSADAVNKKIFDQLLVGFSDANALMREETLKSLVHIIDKLDENLMNDKLPRCITSLQGDGEPSIRTNSVIFMGRILPKLKKGVAVRLLCTSVLKAMKDGFAPCRLAALKSLNSNIDMVDCGNLISKVMPVVATTTVDRVPDVRDLSIRVLESSLATLRGNHDVLCREEAKVRAPTTPTKGDVVAAASSTASGVTASSSVFSWAVNSLSKSLENVAEDGGDTGPVPPSPAFGKGVHPVHKVEVSSSVPAIRQPISVPAPHIAGLSRQPPSNVSSTAWDEEEDDLDFDESSPPAVTKKVSTAPALSSDGWSEDDLDFGDDGAASSSKLNIARSQAVSKATKTTIPSSARDRTTSASTLKKGMSLAKHKKAAVLKISTTDDDDWDF